MFHFLSDEMSNKQEHVPALRMVRQIGRWNAGSLVLHRDAAPDIANLLLVVDAMRYGMMEIAGCALCLWAIP